MRSASGAFWRPDPEERSKTKRARRVQDTEDGLSEFPHVIVNQQVRMLAYLVDHLERSPSRSFYGLQAVDVEVETSGASEHPVTVTLQHMRELEATGECSLVCAASSPASRELTRRDSRTLDHRTRARPR
jgi:phenol 2-monooxygenase (NADPH)